VALAVAVVAAVVVAVVVAAADAVIAKKTFGCPSPSWVGT